MSATLIHDGYVFTGRIKAVGPWKAFDIRYRPALSEDILEFQYQRDLVQGRAQMKPIGDFLGKQLIGWTIQNAKGEVTAVTPESLRTVPYPQLLQMLDHVMGYAETAEADAKNSAGASG